MFSTHSIHAAESRGYAGSNLKSQSQVSSLRHVPQSLLAAKEEKTILNATTHPCFTSNEEPSCMHYHRYHHPPCYSRPLFTPSKVSKTSANAPLARRILFGFNWRAGGVEEIISRSRKRLQQSGEHVVLPLGQARRRGGPWLPLPSNVPGPVSKRTYLS